MTGATPRLLPAAAALAFLAASLALTPALRERDRQARIAYGQVQRSEQVERNTGAIATMLGELRASASDMIFIKSERYLHAGVAYAPHIALEASSQEKRYANSGADLPPLMRTADQDFRGFLGNLERSVKPYNAPGSKHVHNKERELLPWFRLMTLSDPAFIRGYRVGANILVDEGHWQKAIDFLNEGIAKNPDHPRRFLLYQTLAALHVRGGYRDDYPWGEEWVQRAMAAIRPGIEAALQVRPPLGRVPETDDAATAWDTSLEEDFRYLIHVRALLLRRQEKYPEALQAVREARRLAPDFAPLERTEQSILDAMQGQAPTEETS